MEKGNDEAIPYHPWDWYIHLREWVVNMVKYGKCIGKYTSPMDAIGMVAKQFHILVKRLGRVNNFVKRGFVGTIQFGNSSYSYK